jgi:hypothetical protein
MVIQGAHILYASDFTFSGLDRKIANAPAINGRKKRNDTDITPRKFPPNPSLKMYEITKSTRMGIPNANSVSLIFSLFMLFYGPDRGIDSLFAYYNFCSPARVLYFRIVLM